MSAPTTPNKASDTSMAKGSAWDALSLQQLFHDALPVGLITLDLDLRIRHINPAMARYAGQSLAAMQGKGLDVLLGAQAERAREIALLAMKRREAQRVDEYIGDGLKYSGMEALPLIDDGVLHGVGIAFFGASMRRRAEAEIRAGEEQLRTLIEALPDGVLVHVDRRIVIANSAAARFHGRTSPEQLIGHLDLEFIPPEFHAAVIEKSSRVVREGVTVVGDMPVQGADGQKHWCMVSASPTRVGQQPAVLVTIRDIADRKRMEMQLRESEERYRALVESMPDAVLVHRDRRIVFANAAAAQIFRVAHPRDLVGKDVLEQVPSTERELVTARIDEVMRTGEDPFTETQLGVDENGRPRWGEAHAKLIHFEDAPAVQVIIRDVTSRRRLNEFLEERVQQRTAELQEANRDLESFCYSVSHDLRAPLRHISAHGSLLLEREPVAADPESRRHAATLVKAAARMAQLVDDLLDFSRTSRVELRHEPVRMSALVHEVVAEICEDLNDRQISWEIGPLPQVICDASMFKQVWENLLGNAIKYTRTRPTTSIQIGAREHDGMATFFVKDNGVGFDPRYAEKLFGVFERLHSSSQFEGTGIGLATVQRIVQRHRGHVWAEGEVDRGATFYFALPRH